MRRSTLAVFGTVLGTTLMIGAKLGHPAPDELALDTIDSAAPGDGTAPVTVMVSGTPLAITPSGKVGPSRTAAPSGSSRPSSPVRTTAPPATQPSAGFKNGTFTGPGVAEKYGTIKVTIVVSGGKITSASATCTNPCSGDSAEISQRAISGTSSRQGLNAKAVVAQSASISSVSGATYTSNAYKQSLAAAVNQAKA